ncbi:hypothetical protein Ais01nite_35930 [Asanoa ishikariensis]|nr:hypothetical protein Ais01nite_35930 [Asanoa ishikariensis]
MVCHLAAMGDVVAAEKNPERTLERNVAATLNVSREAADANAYLIYASTWEVYGQSATASEWGAVDESRYCLPTNYYAATKLSGEHVISATAAISELRYSILRLGTAYGRGMRPHTAIMSFLAAASTGKDIVIAGTGGQTRQFTHIGDICRAFELACDHQPRRALLNIAARRSVSISEVAGVICGHFGVNAVSSAGRHGDPPNAVVDVQAAKVALGWEAAMDFEFGLRELIAEHAVTDSSRP